MFILKPFRPLFLFIMLPFNHAKCLEHNYSYLNIPEYKDVATESFELFNGISQPTFGALQLMTTEACEELTDLSTQQDLYNISSGQPNVFEQYSFLLESLYYNNGLSEVVYNGDISACIKISTHNISVTKREFTTSTRYVTPIWVWVVLPITVAIMILMIVYNIYWRIKKARAEDQDQEGQNSDGNEEGESFLEHEIEIHMIGPKKYRLSELKSATGNFNPQNELGRGGFGIVYKGTLRGEVVAVKRISRKDPQGRKNMIAEVTTIGGLHHKNLVKLLGWCYESNELLLVYEYMPNGSLDNFLFPEGEEKKAVLSWGRRYNIVCGVAQSLDYLHNECSQRVLHPDIKTSNIMLDSEFNACLGDFGLARMFKLSDDKTHHTTHEIAGTRAYMAPEIFFTGHATTQTDIYAFGVLALEVVCGRRPGVQTPNGELSYNIVDWVWEFYKLGMICDVVDPELDKNYDRGQVECVLLIGLACCSPNPYSRPSVRSALQALKGETIPPLVPIEKPAFVWPRLCPSFVYGAGSSDR